MVNYSSTASAASADRNVSEGTASQDLVGVCNPTTSTSSGFLARLSIVGGVHRSPLLFLQQHQVVENCMREHLNMASYSVKDLHSVKDTT